MTTILVNHNGKPQPAQIVNIFTEYVKVLFGDGSKAYLARTPDGRGTEAPRYCRTATLAREAYALGCDFEKQMRETGRAYGLPIDYENGGMCIFD